MGKELTNDDHLINLLAAEALWAISNHTQRARAILKQKMVYENLQVLLARSESLPEEFQTSVDFTAIENSNNSNSDEANTSKTPSSFVYKNAVERAIEKKFPYYERMSIALKAGIELLT